MTSRGACARNRRGVEKWLLIALLAGFAAPAARAQFGGVDWTLVGNPGGSGSILANSLHVVGPDNVSCELGNTTQFETIIPAAGTISVDVDFVNLDSWVVQGHAIFDSPAALVDGVLTQPPAWDCCPNGWPTAAYHLEVTVLPGQVLGLGVWSADCIEGPGVADFTNLVFVPKELSVIPAAIDVRKRFEVNGPSSSLFGTDAANLGDVDGDGFDDVAVIAPGGDSPSLAILSATDGATLLSVDGPFAEVAVLARAGFFDADAVPDVVIGMPGTDVQPKTDAGRCEVRSGVDGSLLFALDGTANLGELGVSVAGAGDVDGDGRDDIVVGELPTLLKKTTVRVLGGPDGHVIATFQSASTFGNFGRVVAGGGDADGDGVRDVIIGELSLGGTIADTVHLFSGATQVELLTLTGTGGFGQALAWAGDVDGDGHDDILIGAPYDDGAFVDAGRVTLVSGATGVTLLSVTGEAGGTQLGWNLAAANTDLTGDGHPDFAADARVFDIVTGELEAALDGSGPIRDILSDVSGDGLDDLVTSYVYYIYGEVIVFHNLDRGPPPVILATGSAVAGGTISVTIDGLLPSVPLLLVVGTSELSEPFKGGVLVPYPQLLVPLVSSGTGQVAISSLWPAGLPIWSTVWFQGWAPDSDAYLGWVATDGIALTQIVP